MENPSLMGSLFDGPESLFGRIFGTEAVKPENKTTIRIRLKKSEFARIWKGDTLHFDAGQQRVQIELRPEENS